VPATKEIANCRRRRRRRDCERFAVEEASVIEETQVVLAGIVLIATEVQDPTGGQEGRMHGENLSEACLSGSRRAFGEDERPHGRISRGASGC
jgi:hypothetical protein